MDYDFQTDGDRVCHWTAEEYLFDQPVLTELGKRVLDKAFIPPGKKSIQLTPMGKSHTIRGSDFVPTNLDFGSRGASSVIINSYHFDPLKITDVYPNFPPPSVITENEMVLFFTHSPDRSYSVPGYDYISNLPLLHLCFLDHFFVKAPLRELIRDTFKEYLRNMKPRPDANEEGAKELKMLYSKYRRLFSPCDPNDLERYSKLMGWFFSPPDTLLPFLRSISAFNQWSLRSLLWDYLTDPVAFLSSFAPHLRGMSMELIWDFKYLLWEYLSRPHYRSGVCLRQVCPLLNRHEFYFLRLLDAFTADFSHLDETLGTPESPITTLLIPSLRALPLGPSSAFDRGIYHLGQLSCEYRVLDFVSNQFSLGKCSMAGFSYLLQDNWIKDYLTPQMKAQSAKTPKI